MENFEEIRRELVFHLSAYLDLYIKTFDIYEKNTNAYKTRLQSIINILNKLQHLREMNPVNKLN